jgi:hypothetical protein
MVLCQNLRGDLHYYAVQMDFPSLADRPIAYAGMEISAADKSCEYCGSCIFNPYGMAFLDHERSD